MGVCGWLHPPVDDDEVQQRVEPLVIRAQGSDVCVYRV